MAWTQVKLEGGVEVDVTVIGGGIVGCAAAAAATGRGLSVVLLEQAERLATGITSRNSEVAHGGMYYQPGSLKARCCVQGRRLLSRFCRETNVPYRECGKLIVAVEDCETDALQRLLDLGRENDVEDLRLVAGAELRELLPEVRAVAALYSPRTAIVDAEAATRAYAQLAKQRGAQIMTGARVRDLQALPAGWQVTVGSTDGRRRDGWRHVSRVVINAAGLYAGPVAAQAGIDIKARQWVPCLVKGNYFAVNARHWGRLDKLVYPVPPADDSGLGVHVCLDLAGRVRLGPDLQLVIDGTVEERAALALLNGGMESTPLYAVDPGRGQAFFAAATRFLPWLEATDLTPDISGIRPKLAAMGFRDFIVRAEDGEHGGLINLIGIDSPGLTSAPALAEDVAQMAWQIVN